MDENKLNETITLSETVNTKESYNNLIQKDDDYKIIDVKNVWQIRPSFVDSEKLWNLFKDNNYVSVGFSDINLNLDLSSFNSSDDIFDKVKNNLNDEKIKKECVEIYNFINKINIGDVIVFTPEKNIIYGIGIVESDYISPMNSDSLFYANFTHSRKINWIFTNKIEIDKYTLYNKNVETINCKTWNRIILKYMDNNTKNYIFNKLVSFYRNEWKYENINSFNFYKKYSDIFNHRLNEIINDVKNNIIDVDRIFNEIIAPKDLLFSEPTQNLKNYLMKHEKFNFDEKKIKDIAINYIKLLDLFKTETNEDTLRNALKDFDKEYGKGIGLSRVSASLLYLNMEKYYVMNSITFDSIELIPRFLNYDISLKNTISEYLENNKKIQDLSNYLIDKYFFLTYEDFDQFGFWLREHDFLNKYIKIYIPKIDETYLNFMDFLNSNNFYFDCNVIENYLLSLKVKPFVILTGNSGTGKTKIAQLFAQYLQKKLNYKDNYELVAVGANWTDNRNIIGYHNVITKDYQKTKTYDLIERASKPENQDKPYFLILDEMNLSYVERYFADFLSALESDEAMDKPGTNEKIVLPDNLFVIGTVNVDETTYMFSPKVLDRANVIEFKTIPVSRYMEKDNDNIIKNNVNMNYLENPLIHDSFNKKDKLDIDDLRKKYDEKVWKDLETHLTKLYEKLQKSGFDFGFRVTNEILSFVLEAKYYENDENYNWKHYLDVQILQKLLPKLHGSKNVIGNTLQELEDYCGEEFEMSREKLHEMNEELETVRYVSFIK